MKKVQKKEKTPRVTYASLVRDRILFYVSLFLLIIGVLGFAAGSFLHDVLHVPFIGKAYDVFGPVNTLFLIIGLVLLFIGIILFWFSLRGGTLSHAEVKQIMTEGKLQ